MSSRVSKNIMNRLHRYLAVVLMTLFGFPTVYQFSHTLSHHINPHCHTGCHAGQGTEQARHLGWDELLAHAKACQILAFKGAVNELPATGVIVKKIELTYETLLFAVSSVLQTSESVLFTSRAPPVVLN